MSKEPFLLHRMFQGSHKVILTHEEIAERCKIPVKRVQDYLEQDIKAGMFFEHRNAYYLTFLGLERVSTKGFRF